MIVFLFAFLFAFPFWMLGIPLYLASAIRQRYPHATILSTSLIIGAISTMTSLAYRQCANGMWHTFDQSYPALFVYRGFPLAWIGWNSFDFPPQPMGYLFIDLLLWTAVALCLLYLFSLAQIVGQWKISRGDKVLIVGVVLAVLPVTIAALIGGRGC